MLLIWVLIVLERAKSSILANGNFREFFLWRGGILCFQNGNSRWPWTGPTKIGCQSVIAVIALCLYNIYGTRCVSDLWQRTHWGHWWKRTYTVDWTTATIYYIRDSWDCDKTAAISSEYLGRLVTGTIFRDHYHYFTQPPLTSRVAQNRFREHSPVSTYMNCAYTG